MYEILTGLNGEMFVDAARRFLFRESLMRKRELEPYDLVESYELGAKAASHCQSRRCAGRTNTHLVNIHLPHF